MTEFHVVGGSKGGIGKSLCASYLIQEFKSRGFNVAAIDCDEANRTLSKYDGLGVETVSLMDARDKRINGRKFDEVVTLLLEGQHDAVVMDNGAHSFVPFVAYVAECGIAELLKTAGSECFLHLPLAAGQIGEPMREAFADAANAFGKSGNIVVWQNEYFGSVDPRPFLSILKAKGMKNAQVVRLKELPHYHDEDVQEMLGRYLTFDEALADREINAVVRSRLLAVRCSVSEALSLFFEGREKAKATRCA